MERQLKLTDFFDPMVIFALTMAFFADIFFIAILPHYIIGLFVASILWPGMKGFITKLVFIIALVLPLPLLTIGSVLAILLSNSFIRFVVTTVAITVLTGGVGTVAEAGALAARTAAQYAASRVAEKGVGVVAGEEAGHLAGMAAGAAAGRVGGASAEGAQAGASSQTAQKTATEAKTAQTAEAPKPSTQSSQQVGSQGTQQGPYAQPPEMKGPYAQPEDVSTPKEAASNQNQTSLKERIQEKAKSKLKEKLEEDQEEARREMEEEGGNQILGDFGPDVAEGVSEDNDNSNDEGVVDLRNLGQ
jgi:signal transduction histidine kinase